jgi:hypothetical protein
MWMYQLRKIEQKQSRFSDFEQFIPVDEICVVIDTDKKSSIGNDIINFLYKDMVLAIVAGYADANDQPLWCKVLQNAGDAR